MKKILSLIFASVLLFVLSGCTSDNNSEIDTEVQTTEESPSIYETANETSTSESEKNILIAYFSREGENYGVGVIEKGNTQIVAEIIAEHTGGELFEISTINPYPESYDECTDIAKQEQDENARPELSSSVDEMEKYDVIYLGYPIWWGDYPMAVYTFLESYDFSGKTIIPFCTHAGSGISNTETNIQSICASSKVLEGLAISGETAQNNFDETELQVEEWLESVYSE